MSNKEVDKTGRIIGLIMVVLLVIITIINFSISIQQQSNTDYLKNTFNYSQYNSNLLEQNNLILQSINHSTYIQNHSQDLPTH